MDKCSTCQYNPQILDRLKNQLPDEDVTDKLSEMFKVFRRQYKNKNFMDVV